MKIKRKPRILLIIGIAAVLFWGVFTTSCLTTDTAYRVGWDIGTWIGENW